jgi:hypothetical protein
MRCSDTLTPVMRDKDLERDSTKPALMARPDESAMSADVFGLL